jgi:two-component system, chemotaxis family, sensor kinase CheA
MTLRPGFSTASEVSDLSGRGVGMDVVRRNVESLRGTLDIDSQPGSGTTIDIHLPLTVTVIDGFAVGVAEETYIIPIATVVECTELTAEADREAGVINLRGEPLPFLRLRGIFGFDAADGERENVVVVEHRHGPRRHRRRSALRKQPGGHETAGALLKQVPGVAGSSILGNGRVALILDVQELVRRAGASAAANRGSQS